jgi:hypothetical protein
MDQQRSPNKKKRLIIGGALVGLLALFGVAGQSQTENHYVQPASDTQNHEVTAPTESPTTEETQAQTQPAPEPEPTAPVLGETVSGGESVPPPSYTEDNSVPAGATARCADGTYSFSQNRRGTCSHHGGVADWL